MGGGLGEEVLVLVWTNDTEGDGEGSDVMVDFGIIISNDDDEDDVFGLLGDVSGSVVRYAERVSAVLCPNYNS